MTMDKALTNSEQLAIINAETSKIEWSSLQRFFAQGRTLLVNPQLDLVNVAFHIVSNKADSVEQWMNDQSLSVVSDELARELLNDNAMVWAVVIKPWVLIQTSKAES